MASTASPYGLRAVNELGGLPYAGSTRQFLIDPAGYNTNIFNGSIVAINTSGYINIVTTNGDNSTPFPAGTIGVFVGCSFTNAQGQIIYSQYYPANTASVQGSAITAYVIDDDRAVFQVQANGSMAQTTLGMNVILSAVQSTSTGSTTTGNSTTAVSTSAAATSGYAFRVVGFADVPGFSAVGDAFTDILVKFNPGAHSYSNATGVA
jgi:hypothetical protein